MKYLLILLTLLSLSVTTHSQNLVRNPSFEDTLYLPNYYYDDNIMNCLCDDGTNTWNIYPYTNRDVQCIGWYNTSYLSVSRPAYYNQDVDSTHNNFEARQVDVPINHGNAVNHSAIPLTPWLPTMTTPADGKAYVGLCIKRHHEGGRPYTEQISQTFINPDTSNYMKEGFKYNVSFKVAKGKPGTMWTEHSLKSVSALFSDAPIKINNDRGYKAKDIQKKYFMVSKHDNPSGYLTSHGWQTVSDTLIAEKDLKYMAIGLFDVNVDWNDNGNNLLPDSVVTPNSTPSTTDQDIYYYIDDVKVINMGSANSCECDDLEQDVQLIATHSTNADQCCTIIYLKVDGQEGTCRINEYYWNNTFGASGVVSFIDDLGTNQIEDGIYVPVDTICVDESFDGDSVEYTFYFKTLGGTYGCFKSLDFIIDCAGCPCDWAIDSIPDSGDSTKNALRLETTFVGRDSANNCCFDIVYINNSAMPITVDKFRLWKFAGKIESFSASTSDEFEFIGDNSTYEWLVKSGEITPFDTLNLGTFCISDSSSVLITWDLFLNAAIKGYYVRCFGDEKVPPIEVSCSDCCPNSKLIFEKIVNRNECCIYVDSLESASCGNSISYYNVTDTSETLISMPFEFCADNSDFRLRVKLFDENETVICIKNYDFNDLLVDCSCCDDLIIDVKEDKSYTGSGCKFVIDNILNDDNCNFDSSIHIKTSYIDSLGIHYAGLVNYEDYESWSYTLSGCESKILRFDFLDDGNVICSKDVTIKCQECNDLDVSFVNADFDSVLYQGQYRPKDCCINVIFGDAPSGNCNYYLKAFYFQENLQMQVDTNDSALRNISSSYDTLQLCAPYPDPQGPNHQQGAFSIQATIGIYDSDGNLICSFNPERICYDSTDYTSPPTKVNIDLDKKLVTDGILSLDFEKTNYLKYTIYNLSGDFVLGKEELNFGSDELILDVHSLKSGVYSINLESDQQSFIVIFKVVR